MAFSQVRTRIDARCLAWVSVALVFGATLVARADATGAELATQIDPARAPGQWSIAVLDVATQRFLVRHHAERAQNPASNLKLVTAAAALVTLGPAFRTTTTVHGRADDNGHVATMVVRGGGDPTLSHADLESIARSLKRTGVHSVGVLAVDASLFDARVLPPAFEQQPEENAAFRAAVAALSVDANAYELLVLPGARDGAPARIATSSDGHVVVRNATRTVSSGKSRLAVTQHAEGDRLIVRVEGEVKRTDAAGFRIRRRVEDPIAHGVYAMKAALANSGIACARIATTGRAADPVLLTHRSAPLSAWLGRLGKTSDNFVAEMLVRLLAARRTTPASHETGVASLVEVLGRSGRVPEGTVLVNGSGLFRGNAVAAETLVRLLATMYRDPVHRTEYVAHLANGGVDGTLAGRLTTIRPRGVVRAKTGTLRDVVALSGYVLGPRPDAVWAFSFLGNGVESNPSAARAFIDASVARLVEAMYGGATSR